MKNYNKIERICSWHQNQIYSETTFKDSSQNSGISCVEKEKNHVKPSHYKTFKKALTSRRRQYKRDEHTTYYCLKSKKLTNKNNNDNNNNNNNTSDILLDVKLIAGNENTSFKESLKILSANKLFTKFFSNRNHITKANDDNINSNDNNEDRNEEASDYNNYDNDNFSICPSIYEYRTNNSLIKTSNSNKNDKNSANDSGNLTLTQLYMGNSANVNRCLKDMDSNRYSQRVLSIEKKRQEQEQEQYTGIDNLNKNKLSLRKIFTTLSTRRHNFTGTSNRYKNGSDLENNGANFLSDYAKEQNENLVRFLYGQRESYNNDNGNNSNLLVDEWFLGRMDLGPNYNIANSYAGTQQANTRIDTNKGIVITDTTLYLQETDYYADDEREELEEEEKRDAMSTNEFVVCDISLTKSDDSGMNTDISIKLQECGLLSNLETTTKIEECIDLENISKCNADSNSKSFLESKGAKRVT
ncbi:uncharacterized protein SCDLUD_003093 [Saccharomycodes ludwigii]|uniref:uncharacterized protein n=1 Tax=Saccharomycodes ludwigii TaxID=36035 RepID=UPI001E8728D6|nr:hypothetical protein SCDLUD_003093 [Saccharomycodes ludwigii]KAH3900125.1 hypothetical protein SCDLUD_003093 [Saccharomycodes ludwigii]